MKFSALLAAFLLASPTVFAADMMMDHGMAGMQMEAAGTAFDPAMKSMHEAMGAVKPSGDVDVDFIRGMIPHHQGAVDMARIELEKGHDPHARRLAKDIIKAQETEIKMMKGWLAAHDTAPKKK